jgi:hypothetical protein
VPAIPRLAVGQYELGEFREERFDFGLELGDVTPIQQAPMRFAPDAEAWVKGWLEEQIQKGLVRRAGRYEELPVVTSLLLVPG